MTFIRNLFTGKKAALPATGVNINSSIYGKPIPIVYGVTKLAGDMILYGNFNALKVGSGGGGGKGGLFNSGAGSSSGYNYYAAFAFGICEGPILGVDVMVIGTQQQSVAGAGFSLFLGTYPQTPWGVTVSWTNTDSSGIATSGQSSPLGYNGIAYGAIPQMNLGNSPSVPNIQWIARAILAPVLGASISDADPSLVIKDFLTNGHYGLAFDQTLIGDLTQFQTYCKATGLLISPAYTTQRSVTDMIDEIMLACNSACFWSNGLFNITPYGDQVITANGVTFTPNLQPIYSLGDNDFIRDPQNNVGASASAGTAGPVLLSRKRKSDTINSVKVEYLDRNTLYNPAVAYANNQAEIDAYGRRTSGTKQLHLFCNGAAANLSAQLQLRRELICNTYRFDLDQRYILLDPMDVIEITDSNLGLNQQLLRITEIQENDDGTLSFTCEEVLVGTGSSPLYNFGTSNSPLRNDNFAPGNANTPIIFEPTDELGSALVPGGGLMIAMAISGMVPSTWGGCNVLVSYDGQTYSMAGTMFGTSRMGVTTADFPAFNANPAGQTIDQTDTLAVDLTESNGALASGSTNDALALNTRCYVGGEIVAYQTATLTAANKYNLTYLVRGAYGTESEMVDHPTGTAFARLDNEIFVFPFDQSRIGSTISIKLQGFNPFGGGLQAESTLAVYTYTIQGSALFSPLPNVANVYVNYEAGFEKMYWDQVDDFRNGIFYEIRQGDVWDTALPIRIQAHPPFIFQGNGNFLIKARCQPAAGRLVYSETAASVTVAGNQLSLNLLDTWDEQATGWTGIFDNGVGKDGHGNIRLGGSGNILGATILVSDKASDVTNAGASILNFASISSNVAVGFAIDDTSSVGVVQAHTTATSITVLNSIDYGSIAQTATVFVDYGSIASGSTGTIDYGNLTATNVQVGMSLPATSGGVAAADNIVFSQPDILDFGGIILGPVYYTIPTSHYIVSKAITNASVNASTKVIGQYVGQNILTESNILADPDILGATASQYVDGWVEISVSQNGGVTWGAWSKFVPGVFPGNAWRFRLALTTVDVSIYALAEAFNYSVQLPPRIDHYQNQAIGSGGTTITFAQDATPSTPEPFNGGPGANGSPYVSVAWQNQSGDTYTITGLSLSQMTIQFQNGSGVARTANITVEGF